MYSPHIQLKGIVSHGLTRRVEIRKKERKCIKKQKFQIFSRLLCSIYAIPAAQVTLEALETSWLSRSYKVLV